LGSWCLPVYVLVVQLLAEWTGSCRCNP
jgi:hypothetical protein